jgi:hypothetical protein
MTQRKRTWLAMSSGDLGYSEQLDMIAVPALDRLFVAERSGSLGATTAILVRRPEEDRAD